MDRFSMSWQNFRYMELGKDSLLNTAATSSIKAALAASSANQNSSSSTNHAYDYLTSSALENDDDDPDWLDLKFENLDLTCEDLILEDLESNIEENLEDELVREALNGGVDLGNYSKEVEKDLVQLEGSAIKDYISQGWLKTVFLTVLISCILSMFFFRRSFFQRSSIVNYIACDKDKEDIQRSFERALNVKIVNFIKSQSVLGAYPTFLSSELVLCLLAMAPRRGGQERVFSTMGFLHFDLRNRFGIEKFSKLAFCHVL